MVDCLPPMLIRAQGAIRFLDSNLSHLTIMNIDYSIFTMMTLSEILDTLTVLKRIIFGDVHTSAAFEIDVFRKGEDAPGTMFRVLQDTLYACDTSFPPGSVYDIQTRQTSLPTPWPPGWMVVTRTACNLEGRLRYFALPGPQETSLRNRMSLIRTVRPWDFEDLSCRLTHCAFGRQLPRPLNTLYARLDITSYTAHQLHLLYDMLHHQALGSYSLDIWSSEPAEDLCSLDAFLRQDFWRKGLRSGQHLTVSLNAADSVTRENLADGLWEHPRSSYHAVPNFGSHLTLRLHLPSCENGTDMPTDSGLLNQNPWLMTHWILVEYLVRIVQHPDLVTITYIHEDDDVHDHEEPCRFLALLRNLFQFSTFMIRQRDPNDDIVEKTNDFWQFRPVMSAESGRRFGPRLQKRLCIWCSLAMTLRPGSISRRCEGDCADIIEKVDAFGTHLPPLVPLDERGH